jgi:hypothetical protein
VRLSFAVDYDIAPDGKHFVMLKSDDDEDTAKHTHLTMVTDWFEELHRTFTAGN